MGLATFNYTVFVATILAVIGCIVAGVGWIWIAVQAFRESTSQGLLCIFVPPYAIYYGIKRWSDAKKQSVIALVGVVLLIVGIVYGAFRLEVWKEVGSGDGWLILQNARQVISKFMEAGEARNISAAYNCWSPEAATEEEIAEYIERSYDDLFASYNRLGEGMGVSVNSTVGEGIASAQVEGYIIYDGGTKVLPFEAWFLKKNEVWKIAHIQIGYNSTHLFSTMWK